MVAAAPRRRGLPPRLALAALLAAALVGAGAALLAHMATRTGTAGAYALPELHGQASWAPHVRPAPGGVLRDVAGRRVAPASLVGRTAVVAFVRSPFDRQAVAVAVAQVPAKLRPRVVLAPAGQPNAWGRRPAVFLLDASGSVRTAYGYPFQPGFVARDLETLAEGQ